VVEIGKKLVFVLESNVVFKVFASLERKITNNFWVF
jgi:hypothetical protein